MPIFSRRDDWRSLLSQLNESTLARTRLQLESMVGMLERRLEQDDAGRPAMVQAVLADYRVELDDIKEELARRRTSGYGRRQHAAG